MKKPNLLRLVASTIFLPLASVVAQPAGDSVTNISTSVPVIVEDLDSPSKAAMVAQTNRSVAAPRHIASIHRDAVVSFGKDVEIKAGDTANDVVVIGGSAKVIGKAKGDVVVIGGDADIQNEVGGDVVAVLGGISAGPGAKIHGDAVAVGGRLEAAEGASIKGETQEVELGWLGRLDWLKQWFLHCALKLRPLAPQVGWVWVIAGLCFVFYALIAAVFPRPVAACVAELTGRPATTFLMGLLTKLLVPVVLFILAVTAIGVFVVPFVMAALMLGLIVGKVAILESVGLRIGRQFGLGALQQPLAALVLGSIIILVLYLVPVIGLLTFGLIGVWGLGGAVLAAFGGLRKEMPERTSPPSPGPISPIGPIPANPGASSPPTSGEPAQATASQPSTPPLSTIPSAIPLPEAFALPRAGFWERMGAAFLDVVLVSVVGGLSGKPHVAFLFALAYFSGMWAWKGTTIGGIVLGLKVVRLDGQPVTFTIALVRGLAVAFSVMVLFLGILWVAWDRDKQGWHDKIAGTVVVRLPRGTPLVCL
jgi:uncharacterized RDD family membrane protein YckC